MDISQVVEIVGNIIYAALAAIALWGAYCSAIVWMRIAKQRFRSETTQDAFLSELSTPLVQGNFDAAQAICESDPRALPQLAYMAIHNRAIGYAKVRQLVTDRFQRDVLSDLEQWITGVNTAIKSAPMLGLLGTVVGMMGAFGKLAAGEKADPVGLANDISLALITTAIGLCIAIPLILCVATINTRIRKLEDLVTVGLAQFLDTFRDALAHDNESQGKLR
ncbi:MAG: MotA/TolQ/ExbB proton channel family protein [Planctomycetota bacterium]|nr:MotA/TolQ/ExbB proton channel family protein [Planctomycetota bacterium]MDA1179482.1 MotA/TolQ/ExbB proton channel family protein [Planctomycetota bacterium]